MSARISKKLVKQSDESEELREDIESEIQQPHTSRMVDYPQQQERHIPRHLARFKVFRKTENNSPEIGEVGFKPDRPSRPDIVHKVTLKRVSMMRPSPEPKQSILKQRQSLMQKGEQLKKEQNLKVGLRPKLKFQN